MAKTGHYRLGRAREHNLRRKLTEQGFFCVRCIKSAGGRIGNTVKPVDLLAIKKGETPIMIQVSRHRRHIDEEEIGELKRLADLYGAKPILAYIEKRRWVMEDLSSSGGFIL